MAKVPKIFWESFLHVIRQLSIAFDYQNSNSRKMPTSRENCLKIIHFTDFSRDFTIRLSAALWKGPKI